jgi:hypothetical protein
LLSARRYAVPVDIEGDAVKGLVLLWWVVDPEDNYVEVPVARRVGDGNSAALVIP